MVYDGWNQQCHLMDAADNNDDSVRTWNESMVIL